MSTAERVAELLLAFDAETGAGVSDHSVSELARIVGRERSQVSRMLKALRQARLVEQDAESRRYRLAWRVRVLAAQSGDQKLIRAARPMLRVLVARTGEVALLSVQEANRSLTVMREESQTSLHGGGWIGGRWSMHYTASGRALLFDTPDSVVAALTAGDFNASRLTAPNAPRALDELLARLEVERQQGYACASEEIEVGLTSVSVPIRNTRRDIIAVINVSGPTQRMTGRVEGTAKLLQTASKAITDSLTHE